MRPAAAALLLMAGIAGQAQALDYRSVAEAAVLYDAPSQKARPLFAIAAGTPVEAIVTLDAWVKVRDMKGDLAWIERRLLAERRMVQVRERAQVRAAASETAGPVFEAEADVVLELVAPPPESPVTTVTQGWVQVRHRDGAQGFVRTSQIWGF